MTRQLRWHVLWPASIATGNFHRKSHFISRLACLHCLLPSLCVRVSTFSSLLPIRSCFNSMDARMEGGRRHIWLWKWVKWDRLICVSSCASLLSSLWCLSLVHFENIDLCAAALWLSLRKFCDCLGENWRKKKKEPGLQRRVTRTSLCVCGCVNRTLRNIWPYPRPMQSVID